MIRRSPRTRRGNGWIASTSIVLIALLVTGCGSSSKLTSPPTAAPALSSSTVSAGQLDCSHYDPASMPDRCRSSVQDATSHGQAPADTVRVLTTTHYTGSTGDTEECVITDQTARLPAMSGLAAETVDVGICVTESSGTVVTVSCTGFAQDSLLKHGAFQSQVNPMDGSTWGGSDSWGKAECRAADKARYHGDDPQRFPPATRIAFGASSSPQPNTGKQHGRVHVAEADQATADAVRNRFNAILQRHGYPLRMDATNRVLTLSENHTVTELCVHGSGGSNGAFFVEGATWLFAGQDVAKILSLRIASNDEIQALDSACAAA
jgi:hypothetical protein